jgi:alpha-ketoglutarate-dependent taurine dioxygenase
VKIAEHDLDPAVDGGRTALADRIPALGSLVRRDRDRPDVLIVKAGSDHADEAIRALGRLLSTTVGTLLVQDAKGSLERDVFDRGQNDGPQRFSATNDAAPMHTDGMHVPGQHVPEYFSLTCIHPAASGGELAFVHLRDVLDALGARGDADRAARVLSHEHWFHTKGVDPEGRDSVQRRVLEKGQGGEQEIQYAREYIDLGHALPEAPDLTEEQLAVLARLDEVLADRTLWHGYRLARGDVALIDNRRVLHSRSAFVNDSALPARRMMRLWIRHSRDDRPQG